MSSKYKPGDPAIAHFVTFTVVGWIDVFSREDYKEIFTNSLKYCIENKGLKLHAWVLMTNHCHLIISTDTNRIEYLVRDIKKFTSKQIIQSISGNEKESRRQWMLNLFRYAARNNSNNKEFQFWKQDYHPIELSSFDLLRQRMNYLHNNPVKSGLVWDAAGYKYSSAIDYQTNQLGLLNKIICKFKLPYNWSSP